ncbi:MAG: DUF2341 domain-containing protein [Candidatus Thorarchaeota archaeon]
MLFLKGIKSTAIDLQVQLEVRFGWGQSTSNVVYCNGQCLENFNDIRFTSSDGSTLLPHWKQSYITGQSAIFWVRIPKRFASPERFPIQMYFGNPQAHDVSNGDNTFLFFDNFTLGILDLSKWTYIMGNSNDVEVTSEGFLRIWGEDDTSQRVGYNAAVEYTQLYNVSFKVCSRTDDLTNNYGCLVQLRSYDVPYPYYNEEEVRAYTTASSTNDFIFRSVNNGFQRDTRISGYYYNAWHTWEIIWDENSAQLECDGVLVHHHESSIPDEHMVPAFWAGGSSGEYVLWDWCFLTYANVDVSGPLPPDDCIPWFSRLVFIFVFIGILVIIIEVFILGYFIYSKRKVSNSI